jgi:hypothetical protein
VQRFGAAVATLFVACLRQPARPSFDDTAIAAACADQAAAICARRTACTYMDYGVTLTYGDDATCLERQPLTCVHNLHVVDTGSTSAEVEGCAQSYASLSCSDFFDGFMPDRCIAAGPGATGSSCSSNAQCASDSCVVPPHQICGTCQPQPLAGASCNTRADCGHDLTCAIPSGASSGACVALVGDGMACLSGMIPCVAGDTCVGDDPTTGVMGTCKRAGNSVGAPCDSSRKTMPACDGNFGLACTGTAGTCQPIVLVAYGGVCGVMGAANAKILYSCAGGGLCAKAAMATTGTCVAPAADGDPCSIDTTVGPPCLSPAICVVPSGSTAGTCVLPDPAACF